MHMIDDGDHGSMQREPSADADGPVETYETEQGTVLYDAGNPLAWIESSVAIPLADAA